MTRRCLHLRCPLVLGLSVVLVIQLLIVTTIFKGVLDTGTEFVVPEETNALELSCIQ